MSSITISTIDLGSGNRLSAFFNEITNPDRLGGLSARIKEHDADDLFKKITAAQDRSTTSTTQTIETTITLTGIGLVTFREEIEIIPGAVAPITKYTVGVHHRVGEFKGSFTDFVRYMVMLNVHPIISILLNKYISDYEGLTELYDGYCNTRILVQRAVILAKEKYGNKSLPMIDV